MYLLTCQPVTHSHSDLQIAQSICDCEKIQIAEAIWVHLRMSLSVLIFVCLFVMVISSLMG